MSGINPSPLEDLKRRVEAQGVPVDIRRPEDTQTVPDATPAQIVASSKQLDAITEVPEGVPVRHTQIDAERRHEEVTPASTLDSSFAWFFLGFAYTLIPGLDRSLIEVYQAAGNITIPVRTHRATEHIADVNKANFSANPWAWLIQGIPREHAEAFKAFVASYRFKSLPGGTASAELTRPDEQVWCIDWISFRIADPLTPTGTARRGVDVTFALPANTTTARGLRLRGQPGLLLRRRPSFAVMDLEVPT